MAEIGFWRQIAETCGLAAQTYDDQGRRIRPYDKPRDNEACYHARKRGDCPYYQMGTCRCDLK